MEKKELTKEQIEMISAGTGADGVHIAFIGRLFVSGVKDTKRIAARAEAAGLDIPMDQVTLVVRAIDRLY